MKPQQDVEDVKFVINFDYPQSSEDYIHRIGRTGRSQQLGTSYAFFTSSNMRHASDLISVLRESNQEVSPQLLEMANMAKSEMINMRQKKALKSNASYRYPNQLSKDRKIPLKTGLLQNKQNGVRGAKRGFPNKTGFTQFRGGAQKNRPENQRMQPNMNHLTYPAGLNENEKIIPQQVCNYSLPPPQQIYNKEMASFAQFNSKIPPPGYNSSSTEVIQYPKY